MHKVTVTFAAVVAAGALAVVLTPAAAMADDVPPGATITITDGVPSAGTPAISGGAYKIPVLAGASDAALKAFNTRVAKIVANAEVRVRKAKTCKKTSATAQYTDALVDITSSAAIYAGRYASATLVIETARPFCANRDLGGVARSVTIDLTTGKTVKLDALVVRKGQQFDAAIVSSLKAKNPGCRKNKNFKKILPPMPAPAAWNVSDTGIEVWYDGKQNFPGCAVIHGAVPWGKAIQPAEIKKKKTKVSYWGKNVESAQYTSRFGYSGKVAMVRQTGKRIVVYTRNLNTGTTVCQVGVRTGKSATVWRMGGSWTESTVKLTNKKYTGVPTKIKKGYKRLPKATVSEVFSARNAMNAKGIDAACRL